jgi:DNA-binding transcriptional MerR regulator
MKDYLTIGELAKLMNVSTHQIRYYEEQDVLFPEEIGKNGYRKYGINSVYTLSHILYLREFDISVADIKKCFSDYTQVEYHELLIAKMSEMNTEINRLQQLKKQTQNVIEHLERANDEANQIVIKRIPSRILKKICKVYNHKNFTVKDIFKYFSDTPNLYKIDIVTYLDKRKAIIGYETNDYDEKDCLKLPEADYLTILLVVKEEAEIERAIEKMWGYAKEHDLRLEEKMY